MQDESRSDNEPLQHLEFDGHALTLLGTAHVSRASAEQVRHLLDTGDYDAVAVELCASRFRLLTNPRALDQLDLFAVIRSGRAPLVAANLAVGAYQRRLADDLGIEPGAEMRAAAESARQRQLPVWLIDRDVGITLKRVYRSLPWWQRLNLLSGLLASLVSRESVTEAEIERLKQGDVLSGTFGQFAEQAPALYRALIDERDRYMAARLRQELRGFQGRRALAVIGAGHLRGVTQYLTEAAEPNPEAVVAELDALPPARHWLRYLPWLIVVLVLCGFAVGFWRSPQLGWQLVTEWVVINGGLAALGSLLAGAHPFTVVGAFLAAPLTSLNPTVGAGMVTAGIEIALRKPRVVDFRHLQRDAGSPGGWWRNRVTRVLLVFLFSTLGSAIGTYVAGFRIVEQIL